MIQLQALLSSLKYWFPIPLLFPDTNEEDALPFIEKQQLSLQGIIACYEMPIVFGQQ
ncbi:hypothetical protein [Chitinophaga sp. S165]|uniref:hypothetical protein n=1 Tax=Chitinophaga sp. S165 TaxID=2135462 RepID=UPI000D9F1D12|nr:hypothetical protein [Chitinophaga sp. S165]PWV56211.1 hypothetical protein C7475_101726 [Chitinophaga sp. S165]